MAEEHQQIFDYVTFLLGTAISVLAIVLAFTTFPPDSGPHRGGLSLAPALIVASIIFGGAITGAALSRKFTFGWTWLRPIVLGLAWMGTVTTVIVIYGQHAAPKYFNDSFVSITYRTVLGFGAALLVATELTSILIGKRSTRE